MGAHGETVEPFSQFHQGVDFPASSGDAVRAIADGTVVAAGAGGAYGNRVIFHHVIDGQSVTSLYAHLLDESISVAPGDPVIEGEVIAGVGSSGRSSGAHLHLEIRVSNTVVEPLGWIAEHVH